MEEIKVKSIERFSSIIEKLKKENDAEYPNSTLIFRGQSNIDWNITSSAYRYMHDCYPTIKITSIIMDTFKECVQNDMYELKQVDEDAMKFNDNDEDKIMCMLQHLGGKSTFIDFSVNPNVALFFACEQFHNSKDGVVFVMRCHNNEIYNKKEKIGKYKCVSLDKRNPAYSRVRVQNSCFLKPDNDGLVENENVIKIVIDSNCKASILEELKPTIDRKAVYPDIWGYIGNQRYYILDGHNIGNKAKHVETLKSIVFRETSQLIKDGTTRRMEDVFKTLDNLSKLNGLNKEDCLRIKYLQVRALMCAMNFDEALLILNTIEEPYIQFQPINDVNARDSEQFDPIDKHFVRDFEIAKCYMGKLEYGIAQEFFNSAYEFVKKNGYTELKHDIVKQQATSLVKKNKYNLSLALDKISELGNDDFLRPDIAALLIEAGEYEEAIKKLKGVNGDYALSLLAYCYLSLSKLGDKQLYLDKAISIYQQAISLLEERNPEKGKYKPRTYDHDHHFKLALAYDAASKYEEAKRQYEIIIEKPYENEEAMHNLAYLMYLHIDKYGCTEVINRFFKAIKCSRKDKNPKNFNDLGQLLMDIYHQKVQYSESQEKFKSMLKKNLEDVAISDVYPESIQIEFNRIINSICSKSENTSLENILLQTSESLFYIADTLNRKDAFANKNIADIYYEKFIYANNERMKREFAQTSLRRYILANSYYLIDNKKCKGIDEKIKELEQYLKREILLVNK